MKLSIVRGRQRDAVRRAELRRQGGRRARDRDAPARPRGPERHAQGVRARRRVLRALPRGPQQPDGRAHHRGRRDRLAAVWRLAGTTASGAASPIASHMSAGPRAATPCLDVTPSAPGGPDRWVTIGACCGDAYSSFSAAGPVAFVFGGAGAARDVDEATFSANNPNGTRSGSRSFHYAWRSVTVPPGGNRGPDAFRGAQRLQHRRQCRGRSARAIAARSARRPLRGRDRGDRQLRRPGQRAERGGPAATSERDRRRARARGRQRDPRRWGDRRLQERQPDLRAAVVYGTNANGEFSFTGAPGHPVPIERFQLFAKYPRSMQYPPQTQTDAVSFPTGATTVAHDITFRDYGLVAGVVRRPNGAPVGGVPSCRSAAARNHRRGWPVPLRGPLRACTTRVPTNTYVPPASYAVTGALPHPQGTAINIVPRRVDSSRARR